MLVTLMETPDFSGKRIGEDDIIILRTYAYA